MDVKRITCNTAIEAEGLRAKLAEAGIKSVTYDETNSKVARWVLNSTVDVMVNDCDYDRAVELYQQMATEKQAFIPWCPECGGENVECLTKPKAKKGRWAMYLAAILAFIPFSNLANVRKYRCRDCGKEFERAG